MRFVDFAKVKFAIIINSSFSYAPILPPKKAKKQKFEVKNTFNERKNLLNDDMIITPQIVQKMGEIIAFCCLRTIIARSDKNLSRLLQGLVDNINKPVEG